MILACVPKKVWKGPLEDADDDDDDDGTPS